jgi:hypothetical protein
MTSAVRRKSDRRYWRRRTALGGREAAVRTVALCGCVWLASGCHTPTTAQKSATAAADTQVATPHSDRPVTPVAGSAATSAPSSAAATDQPGAGTKPGCSAFRPTPAHSNGASCGPLDCRSFDQAADAIAYVVADTSPLVLAVGEIHVQKDANLARSPTQHFASLLPMFCGITRHIVIEIWTGRNDCGDRRVEQVQKAQKPVTQAQAATNKNDFYELGNVAKANRIQPHALTPSCEDYQSILSANDQDIARMLELTATRTADLTEQLLKASTGTGNYPYVILYGGAMHNDLVPNEGREAFSYGPRLDASTNHRVTELDIVLREQIRDTESYRRLAWYPHVRAETPEKRFMLYRLSPRSFTLIYPNQSTPP